MVMASADNDSMDRLLESFLSISDPGISVGLSLKQVVELKASKSEMFILSRVSIEYEVDKIQIAMKCMMGAQTETELEEKKLRVEDALNATKAVVEEGIVVSGGCALLRLASKVDAIKDSLYGDEQKVGADIVKRGLSYPLKLIAKNAGVNGSVVTEKVLANDNLKFGYNAATANYKDLMAAGIFDPTKAFSGLTLKWGKGTST